MAGGSTTAWSRACYTANPTSRSASAALSPSPSGSYARRYESRVVPRHRSGADGTRDKWVCKPSIPVLSLSPIKNSTRSNRMWGAYRRISRWPGCQPSTSPDSVACRRTGEWQPRRQSSRRSTPTSGRSRTANTRRSDSAVSGVRSTPCFERGIVTSGRVRPDYIDRRLSRQKSAGHIRHRRRSNQTGA